MVRMSSRSGTRRRRRANDARARSEGMGTMPTEDVVAVRGGGQRAVAEEGTAAAVAATVMTAGEDGSSNIVATTDLR